MKKFLPLFILLLAAVTVFRADAIKVETPTYLPLILNGTSAPILGGCAIFPENNIWNRRVDSLPVHPSSNQYVSIIGSDKNVHADFGSGEWEDFPIGIPYVIVPPTQLGVTITFAYDDESDPGPYPIPANPPIEGNPNGTGDRHILILQQGTCKLYEIYAAKKQSNGTWTAGSGAVFDLNSNALRPDGWTSADAAGLPILPGLVRYDEVASGEIRHAIRFTAEHSPSDRYVWPARHKACSGKCNDNAAPFGTRFRLKASFNVNSLPSPEARVIARAMQVYGLILADNGSNWYISGVPDERWDNDALRELRSIHGSSFEAVDTSGLMIDRNSGQSR